jgi:hypothetical protein
MRSYRECDSVWMPSVTPTREQVPVCCTQFTCFTSTKVQILQLVDARAGVGICTQFSCFTGSKVQILQLVAMIASLLSKVRKDHDQHAQVLSILALLVQKYEY